MNAEVLTVFLWGFIKDRTMRISELQLSEPFNSPLRSRLMRFNQRILINLLMQQKCSSVFIPLWKWVNNPAALLQSSSIKRESTLCFQNSIINKRISETDHLKLFRRYKNATQKSRSTSKNKVEECKNRQKQKEVKECVGRCISPNSIMCCFWNEEPNRGGVVWAVVSVGRNCSTETC